LTHIRKSYKRLLLPALPNILTSINKSRSTESPTIIENKKKKKKKKKKN